MSYTRNLILSCFSSILLHILAIGIAGNVSENFSIPFFYSWKIFNTPKTFSTPSKVNFFSLQKFRKQIFWSIAFVLNLFSIREWKIIKYYEYLNFCKKLELDLSNFLVVLRVKYLRYQKKKPPTLLWPKNSKST